jgi:hypothetical protein
MSEDWILNNIYINILLTKNHKILFCANLIKSALHTGVYQLLMFINFGESEVNNEKSSGFLTKI